MVNPNKTHITVVLDRSGSMQDIAKDTVGGYNTFVEKQKTNPGETTVTLVRFDHEYVVDYANCPVAQVPELTVEKFEPRGWTALLDAMGRAIDDLGAQLRSLPENERPGQVVFVVITDGAENSSKNYNNLMIRKMIERQTNQYNWQFIYLGANQDAIATATTYGISANKTMNFHATGQSVNAMFAATASNVSSYASTRSVEATDFSAAQISATSGGLTAPTLGKTGATIANLNAISKVSIAP